LAALVVASLGGQAHAHLVSTELGSFYDGAAHPLVTPEDLLTILGLAVLAAFRGPQAGRRVLIALTTGWCLGVSFAFGIAADEWQFRLATAGIVLALGLSGLLRLAVPTGALVLAGGIIGLMRGAMNGSAARVADGEWLSVMGIATGVFVLAALLSGFSLYLEKRGASIVLRIGASWIAAIGLLSLGWELQGG
jgi:hydrogenase/urease accessory protein HupE